jgi:myo-inositol-1(or 4)-monophosphatase
LIGLTHHGRPVYGMLNQPFSRERFSGDGKAARYEGPAGRRTLRVRGCQSVSEAVISTTHPGMMAPAERQRYDRLEIRAKLSRYGGDCYAYAMLAAGHIDLVVESGLNPYDIVAIIPIVEGAGGVITSWSGGDASGGGSIIAASDARVHEEALAILNS